MIYLFYAGLLVLIAAAGLWIYNEGWQRGYGYGYSAGLLADDKLDITFGERE